VNQETRWRYQKRIKELEEEARTLRPYKNLCIEIFDAMTENHMNNKGTNEHWLVRKFRQVFK